MCHNCDFKCWNCGGAGIIESYIFLIRNTEVCHVCRGQGDTCDCDCLYYQQQGAESCGSCGHTFIKEVIA